MFSTTNPFTASTNNVLSGISIGQFVFVLIDNLGFFIPARFEGRDSNGNALFLVDGVVIRVPLSQVKAVAV